MARRPLLTASETGERALSLFDSGRNCAQASLDALRQAFESDEVPDTVAACFGGGMGMTGGPCGILTGALMAAGLIFGSSDPDDREAKYACYDLAAQLIEDFEALGGSINCADLTGRLPREPLPEGAWDRVCVPFLESFVRICHERFRELL